MPLELIRVDERLLHGQVVVGWGQRLGLRWYVVADDELAGSAWEQDLYAGGLPEGVEAEFRPVDEAAADLERLDARPEPGGLLLRGTAELRRMAEAGVLEGRRVNLGCLAADPGRREVRPWLHLSEREAADVRAAVRAGAEVGARDVPGSPRVPVREVLETVEEGR